MSAAPKPVKQVARTADTAPVPGAPLADGRRLLTPEEVTQLTNLLCRHPVAPLETERAYYSFDDLAARWRCSRASVYNVMRGQKVLDFARPGHRGHKLVPIETVRRVEARHMRVLH